jgi:hypothetical protein
LWVYHQRPNGGPVVHFGRNPKRDLLRIELSLDPPPVGFRDADRVSDRQRNKSRSQVQRFGNIARLATLIQKRSGGVSSRGRVLLEAREQIVAKSMRAGEETADRILRQERAALEILTCVWDGCNERATMKCPWCHEVPYCSLEHRDLHFQRHRVQCRARAMYR